MLQCIIKFRRSLGAHDQHALLNLLAIVSSLSACVQYSSVSYCLTLVEAGGITCIVCERAFVAWSNCRRLSLVEHLPPTLQKVLVSRMFYFTKMDLQWILFTRLQPREELHFRSSEIVPYKIKEGEPLVVWSLQMETLQMIPVASLCSLFSIPHSLSQLV